MLTHKSTNNKECDVKVMVGKKKRGMGDIAFSLGWLGASRLHAVTVPGGPDKHSDWNTSADREYSTTGTSNFVYHSALQAF